MRLRALRSTVCGIVILCISTLSVGVCAAATWLAASAGAATALTATGGASAGGTSSAGHSRTAAAQGTAVPRKKPHTAPVTSHSSTLTYDGPVYEKTTTGQIVRYQAPQTSTELKEITGGSAVGVLADVKPQLLVPGHLARMVNGLAAAPMLAPAAVQAIIWAGNQIIGLPYIFGGGHASFSSPGYDCSGTVSFALHGAGLLTTPEDSSELEHWGSHGIGSWVTLFSNPGHAYMTIAGLRLDTSAADDPTNQQGPRWRPLRPANSGFTVRHPVGL